MNTQTFLAFTGLIAALLFFQQGVSGKTIIAIFITTLLAGIPWYFGTRDRSAEPSSLEVFFATIWVWFRRLVGVGAGLLFLWAGWNIADANVFGGGLIAAFGLFCFYVGVVGQGNNRASFRDDIALYRTNKRRYKWWL